MTLVQIREAVLSDVPILWQHCQALSLHHDDDSFSLTEQSLSDALSSRTISALVAHSSASDVPHSSSPDFAGSDDVVLGSAIYSKTFSTWTGKHNIFLEHLYVDPRFRGQGQGRTLLDALRRSTDGRVEFSVQATNVKSLKFYKDFGAQEHKDWLQMRIYGKQDVNHHAQTA